MMPRIGIDEDILSVAPFTPAGPAVSSSQTVLTITPLGAEEGSAVLIRGDMAETHTHNSVTHNSATNLMVASQSFFTVNDVPVCIDGDVNACDEGHILVATGFLNVIPL